MWGAIAIGAIAGIVVTFGVGFIEKTLKIDDPVGAVTVHGLCGAAGTLSVGLFATASAGELTGMGSINGLFYGGGFAQLGVQALGVVSYLAWTLVTAFILFKTIKSTVGLRVTKEEEIMGLDLGEHGSESYADFVLKM